MIRIGTTSEQVYHNTCMCVFNKGFSLMPASVVRHIYLRKGVGVGGLRKVYGGKANKLQPRFHLEK